MSWVRGSREPPASALAGVREQLELDGHARRFCAVVDPELDEDVRDVADRGLLADHQAVGDPPIRVPPNDQREDLELASSEPLARLRRGTGEDGAERVDLRRLGEALQEQV